MAEPFPRKSVDTELTPTQPRYSFGNDLIGSTDALVHHPSGRPVRIVAYERLSAPQAVIREALISRGLILGRLGSDSTEPDQRFTIPRSARPIAYETSVKAGGAYSYNDSRLFNDLGSLLGELFNATGQQLVVDGNIGHTIAFVEFARPNERQLYFVPGIEKIVKPLETGVSPLGFYADQLTEAFGHNFDDAGISFRIGFASATAEGQYEQS